MDNYQDILNLFQVEEKTASTIDYTNIVDFGNGKAIRVGDKIWIRNLFSGNKDYNIIKIEGDRVAVANDNYTDVKKYDKEELIRMYEEERFGSYEFEYEINKGTVDRKEKLFTPGSIIKIIDRIGYDYLPNSYLINGYNKESDIIESTNLGPDYRDFEKVDLLGSKIYSKLVNKVAEIQPTVVDEIVNGSFVKMDGNRYKVNLYREINGSDTVVISPIGEGQKIASSPIKYDSFEKFADDISENEGVPTGTVMRTMIGYPIVMMIADKIKSPQATGRVYYLEFPPNLIGQAKSWLDSTYTNDSAARWGATVDPNIKFVNKVGFDRLLQRGEVSVLYRVEGDEKKAYGYLDDKITSPPFDKGSPWRIESGYIVRDQ